MYKKLKIYLSKVYWEVWFLLLTSLFTLVLKILQLSIKWKLSVLVGRQKDDSHPSFLTCFKVVGLMQNLHSSFLLSFTVFLELPHSRNHYLPIVWLGALLLYSHILDSISFIGLGRKNSLQKWQHTAPVDLKDWYYLFKNPTEMIHQ